LLLAAGAHAQREFRVFPSFEGASAEAPLPGDWNVPGELTIGRLMYPGGSFGFGGDWRQGNTSWTDDYPKGDRKLIEMMRRYTRTNVRGVEQPVNLEDKGDAFYYPFMVVGLASAWQLTDEMPRSCASICCAAAFCSATASSARATGTYSKRV
jgi:hypothetical protein